MSAICSESIGECWLACIKKVLQEGTLWHDEDVSIREYLGLSVKITAPDTDDDIIKKFGDEAVLEHTIQKFEEGVVMSNRPFTYSNQIYNKDGVNQFNWLVDRLNKKRETKSATISLLDTGSNDDNLPCLTTIDAKIRDDKLDMQFFYRGQNIVGRQYANFIALAHLQKKLAKALSVPAGFLGGYIASAHIYEYDFPFAEHIINNQECKLTDHFYDYGPRSIRENKIFKS